MSPRVLVTAALVSTALLHAVAQGPASSGAATVSGVVVDDASEARVRGAVVALMRPAGSVERQALTDDNGRFIFPGVNPGRFVIEVTKNAYVQPRWTPGQPPRMVAIASEPIDVTLRVRRGGVVTGVVRDASGRPIAGATVSAQRCVGFGVCEVGPDVPRRATTDGEGGYRLFGLADGEYLIAAAARLSGTTAPIEATSSDALRWLDDQRLGITKGSASAPPRASGVPVAYATTYFPGTVTPGDAASVQVVSGELRDAIDITIQLAAMARITGVILDERGGANAPQNVSVLPNERKAPSGLPTTVSVSADSSFETAHLPPGRYRIGALASSDGKVVSGFADVTVQGAPVSDVTIQMQPGVNIAGRVIGASAADRSGIRLEIRRSTVAVRMAQWDSATAVTDSAGVFTLLDVSPGEYDVTCRMPRTNAPCPAAAFVGDDDILDSGLTVERRIDDLRIDFTGGAGTVAGTLRASDGSPASAYVMLMFPADRRLWKAGSRRVRMEPVATDGSFEVAGLPPGQYLIGSAGIVNQEEIDAPLLESLGRGAQQVTVEGGATTRIDLVIGGVR